MCVMRASWARSGGLTREDEKENIERKRREFREHDKCVCAKRRTRSGQEPRDLMELRSALRGDRGKGVYTRGGWAERNKSEVRTARRRGRRRKKELEVGWREFVGRESRQGMGGKQRSEIGKERGMKRGREGEKVE